MELLKKQNFNEIHQTPVVAKNDIKIPSVLLDIANKLQGFYVLAGDSSNSIQQTVLAIQAKMQPRVFVKLNSTQVLNMTGPVPESQTIFFEGALNKTVFQFLLEHVEGGGVCILSLRSTSVMTVLRKFYSIEFGEGRRHWMARFAEQLNLVSSEKKIESTLAKDVIAREILMISSEMRNFLAQENLEKVSETLKNESALMGTVSMNQSLLQLVLRRQLDVPSAFQVSPDPAELDILMKKAGF